jgi:SNF2 family DNA or RNA helicase
MPDCQAVAYSTCIQKAKKDFNFTGKSSILASIQALRQISLHTPLRSGADIFDLPRQSARIFRTIDILDEIAKKSEKCLIFIEFLETQYAMAEIIANRYNCGPVLIINGSVKGDYRLKIVNKFQGSPPGEFAALILSPKTGGLGLNLTAATHVIHLTRWWNPAVEDQCSDRAYRIGQQSAVTIHYPFAIHPEYGPKSFDLNLQRLLSQKRRLNKTLLTPAGMTEGDATDLLINTISD